MEGRAEVARHLFAHPLPETLNRIQVWAIARQSNHREAQLRGRRLDTLGLMPRRTVRDEYDLIRFVTHPGGDVV